MVAPVTATVAGAVTGAASAGAAEWSWPVRSVSSKGMRPARTSPTRSRSYCFVHAPMSRVATALPVKFVTARASDMNRSMPTMTPTPLTRSGR